MSKFRRPNDPISTTLPFEIIFLDSKSSNEKIMKSLARIDSKIEAIVAEVREIERTLAEQPTNYEINRFQLNAQSCYSR